MNVSPYAPVAILYIGTLANKSVWIQSSFKPCCTENEFDQCKQLNIRFISCVISFICTSSRVTNLKVGLPIVQSMVYIWIVWNWSPDRQQTVSILTCPSGFVHIYFSWQQSKAHSLLWYSCLHVRIEKILGW